MRYKLLCCALVLLIATPALGQEFSPIVVKTGKPVPSVVRSGEPFKVTYRAEFFDTVLIYEEQMNLNGLTLVEEKEKTEPENSEPVNAEVIGLEIDKNPFNRPPNDTLGFVNVWEFTYTFRIIDAKKGTYNIPSFNFIWVEKRAGVTEDETKKKEKLREMPTEEVGVGYISVVRPADKVVKPPPLDIRDEQKFVSPIAEGYVLRRWAYGVIGTAFLLSMVVAFRFAKYPKTRQSQEAGQEEAGAEAAENDALVNVETILTSKQARKKFLEELKKLQSEAQYPTLDLEKKIRLGVRLLLLAELRGTIRDSMTENEIYTKLDGLNAKQKKQMRPGYEYAVDLAQRLKRYKEDIDSGRCSLDFAKEIAELREAVSGLKLHRRFMSFVGRLVREEG